MGKCRRCGDSATVNADGDCRRCLDDRESLLAWMRGAEKYRTCIAELEAEVVGLRAAGNDLANLAWYVSKDECAPVSRRDYAARLLAAWEALTPTADGGTE